MSDYVILLLLVGYWIITTNLLAAKLTELLIFNVL